MAFIEVKVSQEQEACSKSLTTDVLNLQVKSLLPLGILLSQPHKHQRNHIQAVWQEPK